MKKLLLFAIIFSSAFTLGAQTVITGWTFPSKNGADSLNANLGLAGNKSYDIRFEGTDTAYDVIYFSPEATDYSAAAKGWDNGSDAKFWSIKFKAADYRTFKVSSKQYSTDADKSPRDFKLQWRLSSGTYADVPSGTITVSNDWSTGVVTNLDVPITGQGSSSIYIRWIMTSNTSVNGGTVQADGETRIDDIQVTALSTLGNNEIVYSNRLTISPNPNHGRVNLTSTVALKEFRIIDLKGRTISSGNCTGTSLSIDLPGIAPGTYALSVKFEDQDAWYTKRFVVE
jgi:hypothetical protein